MVQASADLAVSVIYARGREKERFDQAGYRPQAEDFELAEKALAYAREKYSAIPEDKRSDFDHNMYVATKGDTVTRTTLGVVAYVIADYLKEQDRLFKEDLAKKTGTESKHLGEVGGKLMLRHLTVVAASSRESDYGVTYTYKFVTPEGSKVTWFASKPIYIADETVSDRDACWIQPAAGGESVKCRHGRQGDVVNLFGTVKDHTEWKSNKETIVTRCKVLTEAEMVEAEAKEAKKVARKAAKAAKG